MEGLGRLFDVVPVAASAPLNMRAGVGGVTFVCTGDDTFTVQAGATHGGSFTALAGITRYYTRSATDGSAVWSDSGDLGSAVSDVTIASGAVCFCVGADYMPPGAYYLEVVPSDSGLVMAIMHDLRDPRAPASLIIPNA